MNQSGVLILQPIKLDSRQLCNLLRLSAQYVQKVLYVDFGLPHTNQPRDEQKLLSPRDMYKMLQRIYKMRTKETAAMDIRVLLSSSKERNGKRLLSFPPDIALLQSSFETVPHIMETVYNMYNFKNVNKKPLTFLKANESLLEQEKDDQSVTNEHDDGHSMQVYNTCVVGGTFDRIHNGHRLLLSTSCLLSNSKIIVGVSDGPLLENKTLGELIEPLEIRMKNVEEYIDDIKPGLVKELVTLYEPAGPTKTDPSIECLVVSAETLNSGTDVNQLRAEAGLPTMDLFLIDIVEDQDDSLGNSDDSKMSSTGNRKHDLGKLLKPVVPRPNSITSNVYVIGLTGGIASGKSAIAKRLQKLGAEIIDADLLGHFVYQPGTECYNEIVKTFGERVVSSDNSINRQQLGSIVFNDSEKLKLLCSIVWPKIMSEIKKEIAEAESKSGSHIFVIDAAVLIEAGWDELVDEVWVTIIPAHEAVTRMKERNGFTQSEAEKRLHSQITNKERVSKANVVLSTLWEPEVTQKQVEKAWRLLQERLNLTSVKKSPLL